MMEEIGATMTTQYYSGPTYSGRFISFVLAMVLGAAGFAVFIHHATKGASGRFATLITGRAASNDNSAPAVAERIQRLSRMETVVYSLDAVVEGGRMISADSETPTISRMLLLVHGDSSAGIDLAQLKPEDVRIDSVTHSIHVTLPPAQLFVTTLDTRRTKIMIRSTGLLVPSSQALEAETRAKAQDQIQQTALAEGILDVARKNARASVAMLLYSQGFEHVDVN
jgi:hypothetical protein